MLILENARVGEVGGGSNAELIAAERGNSRTVDQLRPSIRVRDGDAWEARGAQEVEAYIGRRQGLRGCGIGHFANKAVAIFPGRIGREDAGVVKRKELAPGVHG